MCFKQKPAILALLLLSTSALAENGGGTSSGSNVRAGLAYDLGLGATVQYKQYSFFVSDDAFAMDIRIRNFYTDNEAVYFYLDLGGFVEDKGRNDSAGVRLPAGVAFGIDKNLHAYIQAVPNIDFSGNEDFSINGAFGIRYQF